MQVQPPTLNQVVTNENGVICMKSPPRRGSPEWAAFFRALKILDAKDAVLDESIPLSDRVALCKRAVEMAGQEAAQSQDA